MLSETGRSRFKRTSNSCPLRITYPGAVYHVTSRGNERKAVLENERDREKYKDRIRNDKKLGRKIAKIEKEIIMSKMKTCP